MIAVGQGALWDGPSPFRELRNISKFKQKKYFQRRVRAVTIEFISLEPA